MKGRFSVKKKTEWSDEREKQYRQDCPDRAYKFGDELEVQDGKVFVIKDGTGTEVVKPLKPNTFRYETWLKFRALYEQH